MFLVCGLSVCRSLAGAADLPGPQVIFAMDSVVHQPAEIAGKDGQKVPIGSTELVEGKSNKAVRFNFTAAAAGFMTAPVAATKEWDRAKGFSFYLKGDGSTNWGGLELIDRSDYGLRYAYCFPLDSAEWRKVTVRWSDLTPELAGPLVGGERGYAPSGFGNFWFGKWFYWRDYPPHSFGIDQVVLEQEVPADNSPVAFETGLKRIRAKLKAGQPVTIVTMGDSLSDKRHWANQQTLWSELLARDLEKKYRSAVELVNPAIGGTTLSQNLVLMPRWVRDHPAPDLVTVWFGFNDWDSGVRGPRFKEYLESAVERIRCQTRGAADVLLLTTSPAFSRWDTMKEMEAAVREVAATKGAGLADIAHEFRRVSDPEAALKEGYWAWDKTHLGAKGHETTAATVLKAIERED